MKFHPVTERYPPLGSVEFDELCDDIRENGLLVPIVVWRNQIIDGRNRFLACEKVGRNPRYETWTGKEKDLEAHVESLNEHRRHLTQEQLEERREQRVKRVAEKRADGKSLRTIAEEEGVSKSQVERDLEEASTVPGGTVEPDKVTGRDGRTRTATPKKHAGAATAQKAAERLARQQANGKPVFDGREFEPMLGKLVRLADACAKAHGKSEGYRQVEKNLELTLTAWRRWQSDIAKE